MINDTLPHSIDSNLRLRLSLLYFLQFAVWGCYLTCFSQLLGAGGLGRHIAWFYSAIGLVSLFTPALMGHLSDRYTGPVRLLATCHIAAALAMGAAWLYASTHTQMAFAPMFALYVLFLAFFMPTLALVNTASFGLIKSCGCRPADVFPAIRVWGTVGFVAAMWFVNSAWWHNGSFGFTLSDTDPMASFRFQYTSMQLLATAVTGIIAAAYAMTLPKLSLRNDTIPSLKTGISLLSAHTLRPFIADRTIRTFLLFAALSGVCLQISNGFATPYITHFSGLPEFAGLFASGNATMLFSLSQISEAVFILTVGIAMNRLGIRRVITIALIAWSARFALLGLGNPGGGLWMLALSMIVYGVAFNFFTVAGHIFMEQVSAGAHKGLGQGMMMLASNGIGATIGTLAAGSIVNRWCSWQMLPSPSGHGMMRLFMGEWIWPWLIFATYALTIAMLFYACFRDRHAHSDI